MPRTATVVGVDLSLRRAAVCSIPVDWHRREWDLASLHTEIFGGDLGDPSDPRERIARLQSIANGIESFCKKHHASRVALEEYAFGTGRQSHKHAIGEAGGVVKIRLFERLDVVAESIVASQARKTFAGKLPRSGVKDWIVEKVQRLGGPTLSWTPDECDAFIVANHLTMLNGGTALTLV